jgi:hypothetical protein
MSGVTRRAHTTTAQAACLAVEDDAASRRPLTTLSSPRELEGRIHVPFFSDFLYARSLKYQSDKPIHRPKNITPKKNLKTVSPFHRYPDILEDVKPCL